MQQCGVDLLKIGKDVSEQLDVEPARFFMHRTGVALHPLADRLAELLRQLRMGT